MATNGPWTVKTTKRKRRMDTPNSRKQQRRASLPIEDQADTRARRVTQQTLTQIQWTPSRPVSSDDTNLEPLEVKTEPRSRSRRRIPRLKKRDSTLTQMDFLVERNIEMTEQDAAPLFHAKKEGAAVPQLDGNYDSPRKPHPPKMAGARAGSHRKRKSISAPADESQEYVPRSKRRKGNAEVDETPADGRRRRSGRRTNTLPSDPAENFDVFQEALADVTPTVSKPTLEIKDSTGLDEDVENMVRSQQNGSAKSTTHPVLEVQNSVNDVDEDIEILSVSPEKTVPKTPKTKARYIPSSQSPESLPPSTRKKNEASLSRHKTTPKRNPLAEVSKNTPSRLHVIDVDDSPVAISMSKRNVCTLQLSRIPLGSMRKRVEDYQADIWAVQPTSSPKPKGDSQRFPEDALPVESIEEELPEIPSTSQVRNDAVVTSSPPQPEDAETQESLLSLSTMFGPKKEDTAENNDIETQHISTGPNVETRDFVTQPQQMPQKATQYVRFLQSQPDRTEEDDDDLGSPVANDTQFVADIARIPTSPMGTSDPLKDLNPHDTMRISSSSFSESDAPTSPLPAPKLVDRVEYQNSTTTIPTKDIASPILPPIPPPTQRLMAPASLPHPSQVSTQEPSQQLPQLSSVPQRSPTRTERITLKDSSSVHEHLSQLPEYNEDELQLQRELEGTQHGILETEDDDDDDAYDDLDPRTPRETVRFKQPQGSEVPTEDVRSPDPSPERPEEKDTVPNPSPPANFTQNGHVTTARIEDMRRRGLIPPGYNPPAYKVPSARELLPAWMFEDDDDEL